MTSVNTTTCCGVGDLDGMNQSPQSILRDVGERFVERNEYVPFYTFTDVKPYAGALRLARYIRKNKLGTIIRSHEKRNPNSGNMLRVWIWETNKRNFIKWYNKENPDWAENNIEDND